MSALDLSADIGLVAIVLAMLNIGIGLLMWGPHSPWRPWPHHRFDIFWLHRLIRYGTLALPHLHAIPRLFVCRPAFRAAATILEAECKCKISRQLPMVSLDPRPEIGA